MEILDEAIAQGMTVVLSTHQMEQVEKLCHSIALINQGEVVLKGNVGDIRKEYGSRAVSVAFAEGAELQDAQFADLAEKVILMPNEARFIMRPEAHAGKILKRLLELGVKVSRFEEAQASMHDIFVQVVTGPASAGDGHVN
jgi:ABC-2 type transport system ATP-binding protein